MDAIKAIVPRTHYLIRRSSTVRPAAEGETDSLGKKISQTNSRRRREREGESALPLAHAGSPATAAQSSAGRKNKQPTRAPPLTPDCLLPSDRHQRRAAGRFLLKRRFNLINHLPPERACKQRLHRPSRPFSSGSRRVVFAVSYERLAANDGQTADVKLLMCKSKRGMLRSIPRLGDRKILLLGSVCMLMWVLGGTAGAAGRDAAWSSAPWVRPGRGLVA